MDNRTFKKTPKKQKLSKKQKPPTDVGVDALAPSVFTSTSASTSLSLTIRNMDTDNSHLISPSTSCGTPTRGKVDSPTLDVINDSLNRQSRVLLSKIDESFLTSTNLDDEQVDEVNDSTLTNEEEIMETTIIPSTGQAESSPLSDKIVPPICSGEKPSQLLRQTAVDEVVGECDVAMEVMDESQKPSTSKRASKEAMDRKDYRFAISYCGRFVDKDPKTITEREFKLIKKNLKFMRRFERKYPHLTNKDFLINKIPTSSEGGYSAVTRTDVTTDHPPTTIPAGDLAKSQSIQTVKKPIRSKTRRKKTAASPNTSAAPSSKPVNKVMEVGRLMGRGKLEKRDEKSVPVKTPSITSGSSRTNSTEPVVVKRMRSSEEQPPAAKKSSLTRPIISQTSAAPVIKVSAGASNCGASHSAATATTQKPCEP
ncbi:uncharacterized protein [Musca autumnalis]|uniref:uncharacterized protein n=1 Tax=Musca autumnalis TaxID=221902 RepID=UPI003CE9A0FC